MSILEQVKKLLIFLILLIFHFNGISSPFKNAQNNNCNQPDVFQPTQDLFQKSSSSTLKLANFHITLFEKELDFDDLLEFSACSDFSGNEHFLNNGNDLLPDQANKDSQPSTFKYFKSDYCSDADYLFQKYPDTYLARKISDHYLIYLPAVFLNSEDHPPQIFS